MSAKDKEEDRQFVTALARGLSILECFSAESGELGTAEIARRLDLPQPTIWRLCHTLLELGYLEQSAATSKLRPGLRALSLGYAALGGLPIADLALPAMEELARRFEGAVSLSARQGGEMVYLQRCQGSAIIFTQLRVGSRLGISRSVSGWAYLAALSEAQRKALIAELKKDDPRSWRTIEPRLHQSLADFPKLGFIKQKGLIHPEINSAAVPLKLVDREDPLTLSAGGIASRFDDAKLAELGAALAALARRLSSAARARQVDP